MRDKNLGNLKQRREHLRPVNLASSHLLYMKIVIYMSAQTMSIWVLADVKESLLMRTYAILFNGGSSLLVIQCINTDISSQETIVVEDHISSSHQSARLALALKEVWVGAELACHQKIFQRRKKGKYTSGETATNGRGLIPLFRSFSSAMAVLILKKRNPSCLYSNRVLIFWKTHLIIIMQITID